MIGRRSKTLWRANYSHSCIAEYSFSALGYTVARKQETDQREKTLLVLSLTDLFLVVREMERQQGLEIPLGSLRQEET